RDGARLDPRRRRGHGVARPEDAGPKMTIQAAGPQPESSATPATKNAPPVIEPARTRAGADLWRAVARNKKALVGCALLLFFLVLSIFPGQIAPYDGQAEIFDPGLGPSWHHWFGTTAYGQDVLSQLIWSTRQSVVIAFAVGGLATVLAVLVGVSAAYLGGMSDGVLSLVTDVILVIP